MTVAQQPARMSFLNRYLPVWVVPGLGDALRALDGGISLPIALGLLVMM